MENKNILLEKRIKNVCVPKWITPSERKDDYRISLVFEGLDSADITLGQIRELDRAKKISQHNRERLEDML